MKVNIRADSVEIEGYVNAVERDSKPLMSRLGRFVERICKGAFRRALSRADDVKILLNHNWRRVLGSTATGNLTLEEDAIGLRVKARITDPEVIEDARKGNLVGWSFGFKDKEVENDVEGGLPLRKVRDMELLEVSLINRAMNPCYEGTLVTVRAEDGTEDTHFRGEDLIDEEVETTEEPVDKPVENERSTEESTNESEKQEEKDPVVEKPVEKNVKTNYNKATSIIKSLKEDK